ncbi:MAG: hypothetical protein WBD75_10135 [Phycisphaerae bacterium]
MSIERSLALYDEGMALPHVIEDLLSACGNRTLDVGTRLAKAALAMPDHSVNRIRTPIKKQLGPGCLKVGDTIIIIIKGSPFEDMPGEEERIFLVRIGTDESGEGDERCSTTTCCQLSQFIAQIVTFRAVFSKHIIRNWLAAIHV